MYKITDSNAVAAGIVRVKYRAVTVFGHCIADRRIEMSKKQIIKLICLNLGLALLNVVLFSKGLVGLTLGGDALITALAVTDIVMSLIAFGYGNYSLLFKQQEVKLLKSGELMEPKDYIEALEDRKDKKVFEPEINTAIDQVYRLLDKDRALETILLQYFTPQEMTYVRFKGVIDSVNSLFFSNVKKMINRIIIFDEKDYNKTLEKINKQKNMPTAVDPYSMAGSAGAHMQIYDQHIGFVRGVVSDNEGILVKLDSLLLEISKLDDMSDAGLENMAAIREINELIDQTKLYKQS